MSETLKGEVMSLEEQIKYHLEYNLTVPAKQTHIDRIAKISVIALEHVNNHDLDYVIPLPEGLALVRPDGTLKYEAYAWQVVHGWHLEQWLNEEWF